MLLPGFRLHVRGLAADFKPFHQRFLDFLQVLILELDGDPPGGQ